MLWIKGDQEEGDKEYLMEFPLPRTDCCVAASLCRVHSRGQHERRRRAGNESSLSNKAVKHALYIRVGKRKEAADQKTRHSSVLADQSSKVLFSNNRETLLTAFASIKMLHHTRLVPGLPVYSQSVSKPGYG